MQNNLNTTEVSYNMYVQQFMNVIEALKGEPACTKCEIQSQNQEYQDTPCYQETVGSGELPVA